MTERPYPFDMDRIGEQRRQDSSIVPPERPVDDESASWAAMNPEVGDWERPVYDQGFANFSCPTCGRIHSTEKGWPDDECWCTHNGVFHSGYDAARRMIQVEEGDNWTRMEE